MKKPFKETKAYSILKPLAAGIWDVLPLPNLRTFFDTDGDGKITRRDLKGVAWIKLAGSVIAWAVLIEIVVVHRERVLQ